MTVTPRCTRAGPRPTDRCECPLSKTPFRSFMQSRRFCGEQRPSDSRPFFACRWIGRLDFPELRKTPELLSVPAEKDRRVRHIMEVTRRGDCIHEGNLQDCLENSLGRFEPGSSTILDQLGRGRMKELEAQHRHASDSHQDQKHQDYKHLPSLFWHGGILYRARNSSFLGRRFLWHELHYSRMRASAFCGPFKRKSRSR